MNNNFITIHQISSRIIEIIENSKEYCFLITPYFKPWPLLTRALTKAAQKEKKIVFIVRKDQEVDLSYLNRDFGFDVVYIERLHTKLYLNEREALISSMNLFDSSKEYNYEIGYNITGSYDIKTLKEKIIEDDILGIDNHEIIKGRYFHEIDQKQQEELNIIREKEEKRKKLEEEKQNKLNGMMEVRKKQESLVDTGFCIRCGRIIPSDNDNPMCMKCYNVWNSFQNYEYTEQYCHGCGEKKDNICMSNPICNNHAKT